MVGKQHSGTNTTRSRNCCLLGFKALGEKEVDGRIPIREIVKSVEKKKEREGNMMIRKIYI